MCVKSCHKADPTYLNQPGLRGVDRVVVEASRGQRSTRGGVTENVTPGRIRMTRRITNLHGAHCRGQREGAEGCVGPTLMDDCTG